MKSKLSFGTLLMMGLFGILFSLSCGGGGGGLTLGKIQGPASLNERASAVFSTVVTGDTGITYQWAVDPASAGTFTDQIKSSCTFQANDVTADTPVKILVTVSSDNFGLEVDSMNVTIKDLLVGGWATTWGSIDGGDDMGRCDAVDSSGNVYVTGMFNDHDAFLSKFDPSGTFLWTKIWGGAGKFDKGFGVAVDKSGDVYVTGRFSETVDFNPGSGVDKHSSNGWTDAFLSKFDSSGNFMWSKTWGGKGYDEWGHSVSVDDSGQVYVTGRFELTVDFDPGPGEDWHTSNNYGDVFLSKFAPLGELLWARTWDGSDGESVSVDSSGNAYVTGSFGGTVDFDPGDGEDLHTSNGGPDIFLCKFDSAGIFLWAKTWGDLGFGVSADKLGNVYITGRFEGSADFDPSFDEDWHTSKANWDVFLSKFAFSGAYLWTKTWEGASSAYSTSVAADNAGNVYVTSMFEATIDMNPALGEDWHTSIGGLDVCLSKFDPEGMLVWARTWGGIENDEIESVAFDSSNNVYVTGTFGGTVDFDPAEGEDSHTSTSMRDVFLSKFLPDGSW